MGNLIQDIIDDTSNRRKHFAGGVVCGLFLTVLFAAGAASGMEFKDARKGGKWDWLDWTATLLGGIVGQVIQVLIISIIL